jgi:hypothetical protein
MTSYLIWWPFPSFRLAIEATENLPSKQGAPGECPSLQATGLGPTLYLPLHTRWELSTRNQRQTLQPRKKLSYAALSKHSRVDWCVTRRSNFTLGPDFANGQVKVSWVLEPFAVPPCPQTTPPHFAIHVKSWLQNGSGCGAQWMRPFYGGARIPLVCKVVAKVQRSLLGFIAIRQVLSAIGCHLYIFTLMI